MREFLLIEFADRAAFDNGFANLWELSGEPLPKAGGMLDELRTITTPNGAVLHEISFRGDLDGWRKVVASFCKNQGRFWARIESGCVVLSNGTSYALDDCTVKTLA